MTPDEILQGLYDETLVGNGPAVLDLTHQALDGGMAPGSLLFDALIPALEEVGARFERGDFFVPEMLIAGRAMAGSMEVLRPLLARAGEDPVFQQAFARASELAGDTHRAAEAYAEAAFLNGRPEQALIQLENLKKRGDLDYVTRSRVDARIATITPQVLEQRRQGIQDLDMQRR